MHESWDEFEFQPDCLLLLPGNGQDSVGNVLCLARVNGTTNCGVSCP